LESRGHESISRTRVLEDLEMDPEEREIDDKWEDEQAHGSIAKVAEEVGLQ